VTTSSSEKRISRPYELKQGYPSQLDHLLVPRGGGGETLESGTIRRKRGNVVQELIETERVYTKELQNVIEGYSHQWENTELQHLIPGKLLNKKDALFGNIADIHKFHNEVFLSALEACENSPAQVGACFVKHKDQFMMYCTYCMNKVQADKLIQEVGQENMFFRECQRLLGHRLPLSSFLLKPVQRITKYHLLLKELAKVSSVSVSDHLREAIGTMCGVLKYVNNIMHQQSIVGYQEDVSKLGRLLMQGPVELVVGKRKDRGGGVVADVRSKVSHRHVFLYERAIVFCKKQNDEKHNDKEVYTYKSVLKTDQIGLTESPAGADDRKFEIWIQGRSEVYKLVAPTVAQKQEWVTDIKNVLLNQFTHIREATKKKSLHNQRDSCEVSSITLPLPTFDTVSNSSSTMDNISNNSDNNNHSMNSLNSTNSVD